MKPKWKGTQPNSCLGLCGDEKGNLKRFGGGLECMRKCGMNVFIILFMFSFFSLRPFA